VLRRADLVTIGLAAAVHAGIGLYVMRAAHKPAAPKPKTVVLEFARKPEPPPEPAPEVAPPTTHAPAVRRVAAPAPTRARRVAAAAPRAAPPPTYAAPPEPSGAPPPPVYAFAMSSTSELGATVAVPRGAPGGMGSPNDSAPGTGRRGAPGGTGDGTGYHPVSAGAVGSMPEVDADACGRAAKYPREAEQSGIEGDVRLRVALTEEGRVQSVKVLSGLGHGLDAAAIDAIKNRCKFSPALGRDGQPVAFVIASYTFHFELPR
jgi:protein TonB